MLQPTEVQVIERTEVQLNDDSSDEQTSDEVYEQRHAKMEIEEYKKLMPLINPKLYKNSNKKDKQKRKSGQAKE